MIIIRLAFLASPSLLLSEVGLTIPYHTMPLVEILCAGVTAHYSSWRAVHYVLAGLGCIALVGILLFLPETSHPGSRGVDEYEKAGKCLPKWRPVILNPVSQLLMLRSPNILSTVRYDPPA
jgi:hypothetical protein